jgi:pyruvate formate lyase activating enzyme
MIPIKGLQKTSLIDFEPYTACVVFLGGCNFRCSYCHNPDLVLNHSSIDNISKDEFFSFLDSRKKWLDGVCITGGEPCLYKDLPKFISKIKEKGFLVKLDTNGTNPNMLQELIDKKLVDYVAMDIKTDLNSYPSVVGEGLVFIDDIKNSIKIIRESGIKHEFRTTCVPGLVGKENISKIGSFLKGSEKYVLQNFREKNDMIENRFKNIKPYTKSDLLDFKKEIEDCFKEIVVKD